MIGNHEVGGEDDKENTKQQLMDHYNIPKTGYYSKIFDNGNVLFVAKNFTGLEEKKGNDEIKKALDSDQYYFVKDASEKSEATHKNK